MQATAISRSSVVLRSRWLRGRSWLCSAITAWVRARYCAPSWGCAGRPRELSGSRSLLGLKPHEIAAEGIAYVPQEAALFPDLSVVQNLRVAFRRRSGFDEACARALAPFPFLRERFYQRAGTLGGGEQKMLLTARAPCAAELVLIDEVTEGVQPMQVERIGAALHDLNQRYGTAMIVVEQNVAFTLGLARRFIVMKQGAIALAGETAAPNARSLIDEQLAL